MKISNSTGSVVATRYVEWMITTASTFAAVIPPDRGIDLYPDYHLPPFFFLGRCLAAAAVGFCCRGPLTLPMPDGEG